MSLVDNPFLWSTDDLAEPVLVIGSGRDTLARLWKRLRGISITRTVVQVTADALLPSDGVRTVPAATPITPAVSQTPKVSPDATTDAGSCMGAYISPAFSGATACWKPEVHLDGYAPIAECITDCYDGQGFRGVATALWSFADTHGTGGGFDDSDELPSHSYLSAAADAAEMDVATDVVAEKSSRATFMELAQMVVERISGMVKMPERMKTTDGDVAAVEALAEERAPADTHEGRDIARSHRVIYGPRCPFLRDTSALWCSPDSLDVVASAETPAPVASLSVPTPFAMPAVPAAAAEPSASFPEQQRDTEVNGDASEHGADVPEAIPLLPGARDEPSVAVDRSADDELRAALAAAEAARKAMAAELAALKNHVAALETQLTQSEERGQALIAASASRAVEAGRLLERVRELDGQLAEKGPRSTALEDARATAVAERDSERVLARVATVLLRQSGGSGLLGRAVVVRGLRGDPALGALCRLVLPSGPDTALPRRRRSSAPKPPEPVRVIALSPGNALCVFARAADAVAAASLIAGAPLVDVAGAASEVGAWVASDLLCPGSAV
eukprot:m51a1_g13909 hypothetical protein (562) ;mRNA; f:769402-771485